MQLPVYNPMMKSYPEYSYLFTILGDPRDNINFSKWFVQNYIQLRYDSAKDVDQALFFEKDVEECNIYRCSLFYKLIQDKKYFQNSQTILSAIKGLLDQNYYITLVLDHFYLSNDSYHYQKHHLNHECLVFGYDEPNKCFQLVAFWEMKIRFISVSERDFLNAFINHQHYPIFDDTRIYAFCPQMKQENSLPFQRLKIRAQFQNYLLGEYSPIDERFYGIKCYEAILKNIENEPLEIRNFYVLYEHALANEIRIECLVKLGLLKNTDQILSLFSQVSTKCKIIRNKLMKEQFMQKTAIPKINSKTYKILLDDIYKLEIKAIMNLLNEL